MKKNGIDIEIDVNRLVNMVKADKDFCNIHDDEEYFYFPKWLVLFFKYLTSPEVVTLFEKIAHWDSETK